MPVCKLIQVSRQQLAYGLALGLLCCGLYGCATSPQHDSSLVAAHRAYQQQDYGEAYRILLHAAKHGDPRAEYGLGFLYYKGIGAPYDPIQARTWMLKAAKKNYKPAVIALKLIENSAPSPYGGVASPSQQTARAQAQARRAAGKLALPPPQLARTAKN